MPRIVGVYQVFVIELGLGADLARKAGHGVRGGSMARQHFDGHHPAHQFVFSAKHLSHATLADGVDHLVRTQAEFHSARLEHRRLPGIQMSLFDQLVGQRAVIDLDPSANRTMRRAHRRLGFDDLLDGQQPTGQCRATKDSKGEMIHDSLRPLLHKRNLALAVQPLVSYVTPSRISCGQQLSVPLCSGSN